MKSTVAMVVLASLPFLLGPGSTPMSGSGVCEEVLGQSVDVVNQPQVEEASETSSNLVLDVTSNVEKPVRLTVRLDGKVALDVRLPGNPPVCGHPPVYSFAYDLPREPVTVTAVTDQGQRGAATLDLGRGKRWAVVQLQDGFPLHVEAWDSEPQWG